MARIKNIDLPKDKQVSIALTAIYGIGRKRALTVLEAAKVDFHKKAKDLTDEEITRIREAIDAYPVEGDLRREVQLNIKGKMEIGCYQGIRHRKGLPVRGQKTRSNARTRKGKGKVVANKKK